MKLIPLTQGQHAMVDDDDYDELMQFKWRVMPVGQRCYAIRNSSRRTPPRRMIQMHSAITGFAVTDHIDGNGLNDQRHNLREASYSKNAMNRTKGRRGASAYKGVSWIVARSTWRATLSVNGRNLILGAFEIETDAAKAYDEAVREHYGEWGTYNFPRPGERSALTGEINMGVAVLL